MTTSAADDKVTDASEFDVKEHYTREKTLELRARYIPYVNARSYSQKERVTLPFEGTAPNCSTVMIL